MLAILLFITALMTSATAQTFTPQYDVSYLSATLFCNGRNTYAHFGNGVVKASITPNCQYNSALGQNACAGTFTSSLTATTITIDEATYPVTAEPSDETSVQYVFKGDSGQFQIVTYYNVTNTNNDNVLRGAILSLCTHNQGTDTSSTPVGVQCTSSTAIALCDQGGSF